MATVWMRLVKLDGFSHIFLIKCNYLKRIYLENVNV